MCMIAELHGKAEPSEDLLTSYVFGMIASHGILPAFHEWFATAVMVSDGDFRKNVLLPRDGHSHVALWPSYGEYGIPDATLIVDNTKGRTLIGVEVKYHSGLSGKQQLGEYAEALALPTSLHLDKWRVRPRFSSFRQPDHTALLYITRDLRIPGDDVQSCCESKIPVYWLSWRGLLRCLRKQGPLSCVPCQAQIDDLCAVLRRRDLIAFEGFGILKAWSGRTNFYTRR